jgi:hypothetical protein
MSLISKLQHAVSDLAPKKVEHDVAAVAQAVETSLEKAVPANLQKDALDPGKTVAEAALQKLLGPTVELAGRLPGYDPLPPGALAAAEARSPGLTTPQQFIRSADGHTHEPITLTVAGSQAQLEAALEKAGWVVAKPNTTANGLRSGLSLASSLPGLSSVIDVGDAGGPMSTMLLDGRPQVLAMEKNDDHHRGRDHLRVFATGQTNASGQPIWAIAATRDTAFKINTATLSASHAIDHDLDPERDQVMADLLSSDAVSTWMVARALPTDAAAVQHYSTDGNVFQVTLK